MAIGAAGILIFFFSVLIAEVLVSLIVFSYAAHCFLVVLVHTAVGDDHIQWPDDLFADWFLRVWHFLWLLAVWLVPAFFLMKIFHPPSAVFVAGVVALLWLIFPVTLLSSFTALSQWVIFRPAILRALLAYSGPLIGFYAITGVLLAVCSGLWYAGILTDYWMCLPAAAVAGAMGFFIYARLLGRIGLIISWYKPPKRRAAAADRADNVQLLDPWGLPEEKEQQAPAADAAPRPPRSLKRSKLKGKRRRQEDGYDPWAISPELKQATPAVSEQEDPLGPVTGTYGVAAADAPLPIQPRAELPDPTLEGFAVAEPDGKPVTPIQPFGSPQVAKYELELAVRRRPPAPPAKPLTTGVYNFPFYPESVTRFAALAVGFLIVGGLLRLLVAIFPPFWQGN
ncbi:MAG TPA: hypothetical protein VGY58_20060 [Gemmataceae bacterium]|nr:hypothetical protein [Gemmataceae bacterium]